MLTNKLCIYHGNCADGFGGSLRLGETWIVRGELVVVGGNDDQAVRVQSAQRLGDGRQVPTVHGADRRPFGCFMNTRAGRIPFADD